MGGTNTTDQDNDIKALEGILTKIKSGGNAVLTSCSAADDKKLVFNVALLNPDINIYMNADNSNTNARGGAAQIWSGDGKYSLSSTLVDGWFKVSNLIIQQVTDASGNKASIYIDPRSKSASDPIKVTK